MLCFALHILTMDGHADSKSSEVVKNKRIVLKNQFKRLFENRKEDTHAWEVTEQIQRRARF